MGNDPSGHHELPGDSGSDAVVDTIAEIPDNIEFVCTVCNSKGYVQVGAFDPRKKAELFVHVRRLDVPEPFYPKPIEYYLEFEMVKYFTFEPRCKYHIAAHQKPGISYERGKILAWKALPESARRQIIVKSLMES